MDRVIYVAMTGAKHVMHQQAVTTQNLANVTTEGYKAIQGAFRATPAFGPGLPTRTYAVASTPAPDFTPGVLRHTGRDLDVAVQGKGWIAVEGRDGREAYTRAGSLVVSQNGLLQTRNGLNVLGDGGPVAIPADTDITVGNDGTVSTVPSGQTPNSVAVVGRIKLVNPPEAELSRGDDGLFRLASGQSAAPDIGVRLAGSALESSNVNVVEAMVNMIAHARQYDLQVRLLQSADTNARQASQVLNLNA